MSAFVRTVSLAAALGLVAAGVPASGHGQEGDNAIFHYSSLDVDASRSPGPAVGRWEGRGWIGTDFDRVWWSTSAERAAGSFDELEVMAVYGRYVRMFWDVVVGYRQDIEPAAQGYLTFGLMGLAPYWFEVSLLGFVSDRGRPSVRLEAETDLYLTQRLVLQPRIETDWLVVADNELDVASGIATLELGLRGRYEIRRKFAPYLDLAWVRERDPRTPLPGGGLATEGLRLGAGVRLIY